MADQLWYYATVTQTKSSGPVPTHELQMLLSSGQLSSDTRVWTEGMAQWELAASRPELNSALPQTAAAAPVGTISYQPLNYQGAPVISTAGLPYAGFWMRFAAYLIDSIIMWVVGVLLGFVIGFFIGLASAGSGNVQANVHMAIPLIQLCVFVIGWLYYAVMESSTSQATLGKMALGLIVTDEQRNRITFGRASGRLFGKILSGLILFIGFMMAGWTAKKQALHDQLAHTLVLRKR